VIEQTALVTAVAGDRAEVETRRRSACSGCAEGGCGTALFGAWLGNSCSRLWVRNPIQARAGEQVVVGLPEQHLVGAAGLLYGLPLAGLLAGILVGRGWAAATELPSILGGLLGLIAGLLGASLRARRAERDAAGEAAILRRAPPTGQVLLLD
jgi:sigma-E factor negative regulatory protein RseC